MFVLHRRIVLAMTSRPKILASAQTQIPPTRPCESCRRDAEKQHTRRATPNGNDGWSPVGQPATYEVLKDLQDRGFTVVNLSTGGVAWGFKDVAISHLIKTTSLLLKTAMTEAGEVGEREHEWSGFETTSIST